MIDPCYPIPYIGCAGRPMDQYDFVDDPTHNQFDNIFTTQTQRGEGNPIGTIALVGVAFVLGMLIFGRK